MLHLENAQSQARYLSWIARAGVQGVIIKADDPIPGPAAFSMLFLTGGGDVEPMRYGETVAPETMCVDDARDRMETVLIERFLAARKPIFGICRGMQVLNVALGGKLIQHLPAWLAANAGRMDSEAHARVNDCDSTHALGWTDAAPLDLRGIVEVNSAHHQAIAPGALGRNLAILAWSPAGIPEAIMGVDLPAPVFAVQWHPERLPGMHPGSEAILQRCLDLQAECA